MALRIIAFVGLLWTGSWCSALAAENVAVAVFAPDPASARYEKTVQARLEEILRDGGLVVLDEEKAKKMKREWVNLADASHVVTAEEFVANAGKYDIGRVYSISFTAGASSAMSLFYTASAATQLRVIDKQARVGAFSSAPMGIRGFPPSDALTSDAALVNALQRAVDSVAEAAGVSPAAPVTARYIPLKLEASAAPASARNDSRRRSCRASSSSRAFSTATLTWPATAARTSRSSELNRLVGLRVSSWRIPVGRR